MIKLQGSQALILNGITIEQRDSDGYVNATAMCQAGGKLFADYFRLDATKEFLSELSSDMGIPISELIQVVRGGKPDAQGTWVHEDIAMNLAQWISAKFAVKVSRWLMSCYKSSIHQRAEKQTYLELLIADATRPWEKTFTDRLWTEFARLTRYEGDPFKNRPLYWGKLVRDLVYIAIDRDLYASLKSKKGLGNGKLHQELSKELGLKVLTSHIEQIIGIARVCDNIIELKNIVDEHYSQSSVHTNLKLYLAS